MNLTIFKIKSPCVFYTRGILLERSVLLVIKTVIIGMNILSGIVAFIASKIQTRKILDSGKKHSYAAIGLSTFFSMIIISLQIAKIKK
jgi:hypothetical protein